MNPGGASGSGGSIPLAVPQWDQSAKQQHSSQQQHHQQQQNTAQQQQQQQQQQQKWQGRRQAPAPAPAGLVEDKFRAAKFVFAGGLAGAVSRTATAPIDRLKMLLQVQESRHLSLRQGIRIMASEGSVRAYFKGNGTNALKIAPETAIKLSLNDWLKHHVVADHRAISPWERVVCGGVAGAVGQGLVYPLDTVRTRLAVCHSSEYGGIWQTAVRLARTEGYAAFYRGLVPSMCGILPYAGTDIALFEILNERLHREYNNNPPHLAIIAAGMASSVFAQFVSYPLALVRTRLQAQGVGGNPIKYSGMVDVFSQTLRNEGVRGLYKGLLPNLIKLAPAAGISWYVFEETKRLLGVEHGS